MTEKEQKGKEEAANTCRALVDAGDWKDPECRKVLSEYHKEGLDDDAVELAGIEADLETFEKYWQAKGEANVSGAYHKEGAPDLEKEGSAEAYREYLQRSPGPVKSEKGAGGGMPPPSLDRIINVDTMEIVTYALFRAVFGTGVRIPLHREGIVDMDITIKDKDVLINTNQFYVNVPDLHVWRIIYSHKEKTIFEMGRGVPKGMKLHRWNAFLFIVEMWKMNRDAQKAKKKAVAPTDEKE